MKLNKVGALAAVSILAFAACSSSSGSAAPSAAASAGGSAAAGGQPAVCKDKVGKSTTEIHIYSSLPLQGTSKPQSESIVNATVGALLPAVALIGAVYYFVDRREVKSLMAEAKAEAGK